MSAVAFKRLKTTKSLCKTSLARYPVALFKFRDCSLYNELKIRSVIPRGRRNGRAVRRSVGRARRLRARWLHLVAAGTQVAAMTDAGTVDHRRLGALRAAGAVPAVRAVRARLVGFDHAELAIVRLVIAADAFKRVEDNIHALGCLLEDLRKHERYGVGSMVDQAYTGFAALPPPERTETPWWEVMGVSEQDDLWWIEAVYKKKAKELHPDAGGSDQAMAELNRAIEQARKGRAA